MKKILPESCLGTAKLLLCLFLFNGASCSSAMRLDQGGLETSELTLQVAINESDFSLFLQKTQEQNPVLLDVQPAMQNLQTKEFGRILGHVSICHQKYLFSRAFENCFDGFGEENSL